MHLTMISGLPADLPRAIEKTATAVGTYMANRRTGRGSVSFNPVASLGA